MNNQLSIYKKASLHFGLILFASLGYTLPALSEGSQQLGIGTNGLNVYLFEYSATNTFLQGNQGPRPIKVNVENANQVINISLCGWNTTDDLGIEVFRPSGTEINYTTQVAAGSPGAFSAASAGGAGAWQLLNGNARTSTLTTICNNNTKPTQPGGNLTNPVRFIAPEAGTYEIRLHNDTLNDSSTYVDPLTGGTTTGHNVFTYFDITVTPNTSTNPNPSANNGQLWADSWGFNAGNTFLAAGGYDANLYIRTPGGRTNTEFIWQLDLNRFAPQRHEIIANEIGLNAPNSRGSLPGGGGAYTKKYPIYLSPPNTSSFIAPVLPEPAPPVVSNISFIDNAGEDNTISPTTSTGVQDSGFFKFNSDVAGTYKIVIDTNKDGSFGAGDRVLFGSSTAGANSVAWDGRGDNNAVLTAGTYPVDITVGLGEYHFVTFDAETSGGGINDGLSIWKWNSGSRSAVLNFWDDTKITTPTGATKNLVGGLSGTAAGTHTWGNFATGSIGDNNFIDTWVFGTPQSQTTNAIIANSDANDFGDAPDTYGTNKDITVGGTPGSHITNSNLHLGVNPPDSDTDGQPSVNADADDLNGTTPDDEDGVSNFNPLINNATTYSVNVAVKNITGAAASLGGWIDFNKDGKFQSSEGVVQSVPNNTNGTVTLTWNNLSGLVVGDVYARFRLNIDPLTASDFQGGGRDGEIEDYKLTILEVDYGDAPSTFGDAIHNVPTTPTIYLGSVKPDTETSTQLGTDNGASASGDDSNGVPDDEDAFASLAKVPTVGNYNLTVPLNNTSGGNATLHGWIDFNRNGKFEATEYRTASVASGATSANLNWAVPVGTLPGNSHARFRITNSALVDDTNTSAQDERSIGNASNGEVEDYPVTISVPIYDYGDAPDTGVGTGTGNYQTTITDNGAAQVMINVAGQVLSLGTNIDTDDGSLQNSAATADDTTGTPDDEDGVSSFPTLTTLANQTYTVPVSVQNNVPLIDAYLVGYIDFNRDGDFDDSNEKSATVTIPTSTTNPRTFSVTFTTPTGMTSGNTYARFRLGQVKATVESATGASMSTDNGEVEDYLIPIAAPNYDYGDAPDTYGTDNTDNNGEGIGANHVIINTLKLGANAPDAETNAATPLDGTGDDIVVRTPDDEDGISSFPSLDNAATSYSLTATVSNTTGSPANVYAWFDFDRDGKFDGDERAVVSNGTITLDSNGKVPTGSNGTVTLTWNNLNSTGANVVSGNSYIRIRLTTNNLTTASATATTRDPASVGTATNGEVEDYPITIGFKSNPSLATNFCTASSRNLLFILDDSSSVTTTELIQQREAVMATLYDFVAKNLTGQAAIVGFDGLSRTVINYTNITAANLTSFQTALNNNYGVDGSGTHWDKGFQAGLNLGVNKPNVVFFFTDGPNNSGNNPDGLAAQFKNAGAHIYGIGIEIGVGSGFAGITDGSNTVTYNGSNIADADFLPITDYSSLKDQYTNAFLRNLCPADFGDAPDTYGTDNIANNNSNTNPIGANHAISANLFLGATSPDTDANGFVDGVDNNSNATDDDTTASPGNGDDEDGLTIPSLGTGATSYTIPASNIRVTNSTTQTATLHGWIDFNKNGKFDANEYASATVNASTNNGNPTADLTWNGINLAGQAGNTYARFRLTTDSAVTNNTPGGAATNGEVEDYQIAIATPPNPNVLLVKRITAINPGQTTAIKFNGFVDDPGTTNDNHANWPNNDDLYLSGQIEVGNVKPGDEVEYTIYFLSNGNALARNLNICDVIPDNMTFVSNSYGSNFGMALGLNDTSLPTATNVNLSNALGDDQGDFYPPNTNPAINNLCKKHDPNNPNNLIPLNSSNNVSGAVLIKLNTPIPAATSPGTPPNSYGFIRFRGKVK